MRVGLSRISHTWHHQTSLELKQFAKDTYGPVRSRCLGPKLRGAPFAPLDVSHRPQRSRKAPLGKDVQRTFVRTSCLCPPVTTTFGLSSNTLFHRSSARCRLPPKNLLMLYLAQFVQSSLPKKIHSNLHKCSFQPLLQQF